MSTDEYTPSDEDMRRRYVAKRMHDGATRTHAEREYTRWLAAHDARVRRDAKAEAWDECEATAIIEDAPCSENFLFMVTHAPNPYRETGASDEHR